MSRCAHTHLGLPVSMSVQQLDGHCSAPCTKSQVSCAKQASQSQEQMANLQTHALDQHIPKSMLGYVPPNRLSSDGSALISHFDDWANVLDSEAETSLSRRGSGKLHGLEPDMLRSTVDGLLKRQPVPSKLQPNPASPRVCTTASLCCPVCFRLQATLGCS